MSFCVPVHLCSIDGDRESHTALDLRFVYLSIHPSIHFLCLLLCLHHHPGRMVVSEQASFTCSYTMFVCLCSWNRFLLPLPNEDSHASLHQSCPSGMLHSGGCVGASLLQPNLPLCSALQSRWEEVLRVLAGRVNRRKWDPWRVSAIQSFHNVVDSKSKASSDVRHGFYIRLFAERMTAACTSLISSRTNGRWRLVCPIEATVCRLRWDTHWQIRRDRCLIPPMPTAQNELKNNKEPNT